MELVSSVFCVVIPCRPLEVRRRGGTRSLPRNRRRISQAGSHHEVNAPRGVISQKTQLFITTTVSLTV
jgi:hypothetical protein